MTGRTWIVACTAVAAAIAAAPAPIAQTQQTPVFRSGRVAVRLDVLVTDHDKPLTGLGAGDFEVLDDGVPQTVDLMSFDSLPVNAIAALDLSNSVDGERLDHLRSAGHAMVDALQQGDRAGVIGFSHSVQLGAPLTADFARVAAAFDQAKAGGGTALYDATYAGLVLGESDMAHSLLVIFSDGLDTSSWLRRDAVLDAARRNSVVVYGVSVKAKPLVDTGSNAERVAALNTNRRQAEKAYGAAVPDPSPQFLIDLADITGGALVEVDSTRHLDDEFARIIREFRLRYLLSYSPAGVSSTGWHRLEVRLKTVRGKDITVRARSGYFAG
ncbi:MAG TPA: VWA domain-containing protein [Gemmatimonadaceae bacterium]|nr:VWA domain-containing protein [Gemmatimonadaceae bacterium]